LVVGRRPRAKPFHHRVREIAEKPFYLYILNGLIFSRTLLGDLGVFGGEKVLLKAES
jgi:hypothetical protein